MAIEHFVPHPAPNDLMPLHTVFDLLRKTGHPASESTIRRWIDQAEARGEAMYTERRRFLGYRRYYVYVSYSDILMAHRDWVLAKDANEP
ncbi:hypothetical protein OG402_41410 [Streptomyces anulatus]|uniref:hypothetical protein n=1 Tax=Streptomyces anulatus TaxID=1892 RepID=UPI00225520DA|nr:hypothetical protein [Streptomyces anulatus]MCX4606889.1 hypothetical protein [Streptomyces anulatus]WSI82987.1 hypothetical protein OG557_38850 [Streptomyces anulatus]